MSAKAFVNLASSPSLSLPGTVAGEEGGEVEVICTLDSAQLVHTGLTWQHLGQELVLDEHHHFETVVDGDRITTVLTISNLQEDNFGLYSCVASWEGGHVEEQVEVVRRSQVDLVVIQVTLDLSLVCWKLNG